MLGVAWNGPAAAATDAVMFCERVPSGDSADTFSYDRAARLQDVRPARFVTPARRGEEFRGITRVGAAPHRPAGSTP